MFSKCNYCTAVAFSVCLSSHTLSFCPRPRRSLVLLPAAYFSGPRVNCGASLDNPTVGSSLLLCSHPLLLLCTASSATHLDSPTERAGRSSPHVHSGSSLVGFRHRFASSFGLACSNLFGLSQLWRCTPSTPTYCPHRLPSSAALILRGELPHRGL